MAGIEVVAGAILGTALQQLWNTVKKVNASNNDFKAALGSLENRIRLLAPKIEEIDRLNQELQHKDVNANEEIHMFLQLLERARELVCMCGIVSVRHFMKKRKYSKRLGELDSSFQKLLNVEFQAAQTLDIKRVMADVVEMNRKLDAIDLAEATAAAGPNDINNNNNNSSLRKGIELFISWNEKKYGFRLGSWNKEIDMSPKDKQPNM